MPPLPADLPPYLTLRPGALAEAARLFDLDRRVLVVTDTGVPPAYADAIAAASRSPTRVVIPAGEASKSPERLFELHSSLLRAGFDRRDCVVAVGGGVVGDLAGFAAATYMRGIDFYNVPTTLLAQVDSSIGGKTAIDFQGVKNVIGAFHPPRHVLIDPDLLSTLPRRQLLAGLAEAIKMAVTSDPALFQLIESDPSLSPAALPEIIRRALLVKAAVVAADPYESGLRRVLNFGHTIGHAIEAAAAPPLRDRLRALLLKVGLPVASPVPPSDLRPYLLHDKKSAGAAITAVYSDALGTFRFAPATPDDLLRLASSI